MDAYFRAYCGTPRTMEHTVRYRLVSLGVSLPAAEGKDVLPQSR